MRDNNTSVIITNVIEYMSTNFKRFSLRKTLDPIIVPTRVKHPEKVIFTSVAKLLSPKTILFAT